MSRRSPGSPTLNRVLGAATELAALVDHATRIARLQELYARVVPDYLAEASRVANHKLNALIVHADNAAVAAKLKQLEPRLRAEFAQAGWPLLAVQFKVSPPRPAPRRPVSDRDAHLSGQARHALEDLSDTLPEESPVKAALARLLANAG